MLEANSDLTWRDVKHILVTTSDKVDGTQGCRIWWCCLNIDG